MGKLKTTHEKYKTPGANELIESLDYHKDVNK